MADYDVGVVSLSTPASSAPLAQCRPVVSVRNNGLHDAIVSGYIRIYSAGWLVYESEAYSDTIGPGETRPCSAVAYWTPQTEGTYMIQGYFSTPLDQIEPNNNLWPTSIIISGAEPPPPTPVPLHASQHESGGEDEMSIEDLPGRAADQQRAINHASNHEVAGIDPMNVTNMPGILAEAQTPKAHASSHKVGGSDILDVLALPNATLLELVARKGASNGYAGLDSGAHVPDHQLATVPEPPPNAGDALTFGSGWSPANALPHAYKHEAGGDDELDVTNLPGVLADVQKADTLNASGALITLAWNDPETVIATITVPAGWMNSTLGVVLNLAGRLTTGLSASAVLRIKVKQDATVLCQHDVDANKNSDQPAAIHAIVAAIDGSNVKAFFDFLADSDAVQHLGIHVSTCAIAEAYAAAETVYTITGQFVNAGLTHQFLVDLSHSWNTGQQS
ncbi:MAG TPA: hypothetical protein VMV78_02855 [Thiobacillus sp.]|nr:hypothetical protein [Thiobacillus sp.]